MTESYQEWNSALSQWFFRPSMAGRPVFLSVDDETLGEIATVSGWPQTGDPAGDLAGAVRRLDDRRGPFAAVARRSLMWWKAGAGPEPPFVAALSLTVLAASRAGAGRDRGGGSFYRELRRLLGMPPTTEMPDGFDTDIPCMWRLLAQWLDGPQDGRLGHPTAWAPPHYRYVGWALSQCLIRAGDRQQLFDFFRSVAATPGEDLPGEQLLAYLRVWARTRSGFRPGLCTALEDRDLAPLLADVLHRELARWDGTDREASGRVALTAELTAWLGRPGYLAAAVRLPDGTTSLHMDGSRLVPTAARLVLLPDVPTRRLMGGGSVPATLEDGTQLTIRMPSRDLVLLAVDETLGCYRSVHTARPSTDHCLLVRASAAVEALRAATALSDQPVVPAARSLAVPPGWVAYTGYRPTGADAPGRPLSGGPLAALVPELGQLAHLAGGLPLSPHGHTYLTDGAPDVVVPPANPGNLQVMVDGHLVATASPDGLFLSLGAHLRGAGEHVIGVAGRRWPVRLVARRLEGPELGADSDSELPPGQLDVELVPLAGRHVVLGTGGQAAEVFPAAPTWLHHARLHASSYDPHSGLPELPFPGCWLLREPARGPVKVYRLPAERATTPGARPPQVRDDPRGATGWTRLAGVVPARPEHQAEWQTYTRAQEQRDLDDVGG